MHYWPQPGTHKYIILNVSVRSEQLGILWAEHLFGDPKIVIFNRGVKMNAVLRALILTSSYFASRLSKEEGEFYTWRTTFTGDVQYSWRFVVQWVI